MFDGCGRVHDALHIDARGDDVIGIDLARRHQMLHLGDGHLAGGRHHRVEVSRGLAVDEIAFVVRLPGVDEGDVGDEAPLHHIVLAIEGAGLLALGDDGAIARLGEEGRDARAARADALGQRALGVELQLQLAREKLLGEELVLAHIGGDHLPDLARLQQDAKANAIDARIVGDDGEIFGAGVLDRHDQGLGNAAQAKAARHDGHAILDQACQCARGVGIYLFHGIDGSIGG